MKTQTAGRPCDTSPRVLFVDDEPAIRTIAQIALEPEFRVVPAASGAEALALLAHERVDAIVLDVSMPELDGYETLRRLRALPNGGVPVLFLTGKALLFDAALRARGAAGLILKPFDPFRLAAQLRGCLGTT